VEMAGIEPASYIPTL